MKQTPLKRKTPLRAKTVSSRRKPISQASPSQRRKVRAFYGCLICLAEPIHPAHLASRAFGGCDSEDCVVPLCPEHHRRFDDGKLDLLPHLEPDWREEIAHCVEHMGLLAALQRLTGERYTPVEATRLVGLENAWRRTAPSQYERGDG